MDILMSIHKIWLNKIFSGIKTIEFRKRIGKEFKIGNKIYFYETSKNNGSKKIVGEAYIKNIQSIENLDIGTYQFLQYYCKEIIKNKEAYDAVKKVQNINIPNYQKTLNIYYIFSPYFLTSLKETGDFPDLMTMKQEERNKFYQEQQKTKKLLKDCDKWLKDIGYYNQYSEAFEYNYFLELERINKYNNPKELNKFLNQQNNIITKAPQSWCYCIENKKEENK